MPYIKCTLTKSYVIPIEVNFLSLNLLYQPEPNIRLCFSGLCLAFMAVSISATAMNMQDRPRPAQQNRQEATTQKPEVATEDTAKLVVKSH